MKAQKNKQKQNKRKEKKTKETHTKNKTKQGIRERKSEKKKFTFPTHPIFLNGFSNLVYLFLHQNLLSTIHLRY